jgi:hypothetical protein
MLKNTLWGVGFVLACALAIAIRLEYVHRESGEWHLRPSAEPPMLRYHGHVYDRDGRGTFKDTGYVKNGKDLGGGTILAPVASGVPDVIQVHNLRSYYEYRLAG